MHKEPFFVPFLSISYQIWVFFTQSFIIMPKNHKWCSCQMFTLTMKPALINLYGHGSMSIPFHIFYDNNEERGEHSMYVRFFFIDQLMRSLIFPWLRLLPPIKTIERIIGIFVARFPFQPFFFSIKMKMGRKGRIENTTKD